MENKPLVSVLMPVYNTEKLVKRAIDSILNQTYTNIELLIRDDGSTDNTIEIVTAIKDRRIKFSRNEKNIGSLLSRNKLMKDASGTLITFQDADDYSSVNRIELLINKLQSYPNIMLCGSGVKMYNEEDKLIFTRVVNESSVELKKLFQTTIPIVFATSIFRKKILDDIGLLRPFFVEYGNYDYDWMSRVADKYEISNINIPLYHQTVLLNSNSTEIGNIKKVIGHRIIQSFISERNETGIDSLNRNDVKSITNLEKKLIAPYVKDPSLIYNERGHNYFSIKRKDLSIKYFIIAIKKNPYALKNYRDLFYVLRN
jgi:glycosyltransferase involved in cell wall biosynthesis